MTRTRYGSLAGGGLNWDSLPLKLFARGNANPGTPPTSTSPAIGRTGTHCRNLNVTMPPGYALNLLPVKRPSPGISSPSWPRCGPKGGWATRCI